MKNLNFAKWFAILVALVLGAGCTAKTRPSNEVLQKILFNNTVKYQLCEKHNPTNESRTELAFDFKIDGDGKTYDLKTNKLSPGISSQLVSCISEVILKTNFSKAAEQGHTEVKNHTITFSN